MRANVLYRWKDKADEQAAGTALAEDERAELKGLRKENKDLRMENEIVKKPVPSSRKQCNKVYFYQGEISPLSGSKTLHSHASQ